MVETKGSDELRGLMMIQYYGEEPPENERAKDEYQRGWEDGYRVGFRHALMKMEKKVTAPDEEAPGVGDA